MQYQGLLTKYVYASKSLKKLKHGYVFGYRMMGGMEWNKMKLD